MINRGGYEILLLLLDYVIGIIAVASKEQLPLFFQIDIVE